MKPRSFLWIYTLLLTLCGLFVINVPSVYAEEGEVVVKEVFVVRGAGSGINAANASAQTCEVSAELRWHHNKKVKVVYYWRNCTGDHTVRWELDSVKQAQGTFTINSATGEQSVFKELLSALQPGDRILLRTWINDARKVDIVTLYQDSQPVWPQIHTRSSADQACFMFSGHVDPWGVFTSGNERYVFHLNTLDWETPWLKAPNQPQVDWHAQFYEDEGLSKLRSEYWFNGVENPCYIPEPVCETITLSIENGKPIDAAGEDVQVTITGQNASQYRLVDGKGNVVAGPSANNVFTIHALPNVTYQAQVSNDGVKWTDQGCTFQYTEKPVPPVCDNVTLSIDSGIEIPATGTDVQVTVNGKNASQYRIVDDKGNVVAGPSANNLFTIHALPGVTYQAQVSADGMIWTNEGCKFGYSPEPVCEGVDLSIPNGSEIPLTGADVQVTVNAKNATQYRIVDEKGNIVAGPSANNVLTFHALPIVRYQAQVANATAQWTKSGCEFRYVVKEVAPECLSITLSIPSGKEIPADGADVQVAVNALNATFYRIMDDKGNVIAAASTNNLFTIHAMPNVVYQAQVSSDGLIWTDLGCTFQYVEEPPQPCDGVTLSIPNGTAIPTAGADVEVIVHGPKASQYRIVNDKGEVVAGPSVSNVFTIHAFPNVTYQAQVANADGVWTNQNCTFRYTEEPPVCDGITLNIASGSEIPAAGTDVQVTIHGKNATQYRIMDSQNNIVAKPSPNNVFTIHALPNVLYQAQVSNDGVNWTKQGCTFTYIAVKDGKCMSVGLSIPNGAKIPPLGADVTVTVNHENGVQYRIIEVDSKQPVVSSTSPVLTFHARPEVEYQAQVSGEEGETASWSNNGCTFKYSTEQGRPAFCKDVALSIPNGADIPATGADVQATISGQDATKYQIVAGNKVIVGPSASPALNIHAMPGIVYQAQVANEFFSWQAEPVCQFQYGVMAQELRCELRASHTGDPIGHSEIRAWIEGSPVVAPITGIKINWNNKGTVNYPTKEQQGPWFTDNSWFMIDATPQVKDVGFGYYKFEAWVTAQGIANQAYCWGDGNAPDHDNVIPDPGPFAKDNPEGKFNRGAAPSRLPTVGRLPFDGGNGPDKIELILWAFEKEGRGMNARITGIANEGKPLSRIGMESVRNFVKYDGLHAREGIVYGFQIGEHGPWSPLFCPKADGNPTTITVFWGAGGQTWLSDGGAYNDCWWLTVAAALNGWVTVDESVATYNALQPIIDWNGHRNLVFSLAQDKVTGLGPRMQDAVIGLKAREWQGPIVPNNAPADFWQVVEAWRNGK